MYHPSLPPPSFTSFSQHATHDNLQLASNRPLKRDKLLDVGVCPQRFELLGLDGKEWLSGYAAVTVQLLEERFGTCDRSLCDGEIRASNNALYSLCLSKDGRVSQAGY